VKPILFSLTAALLTVCPGLARNPEPLRFRGSTQPPANPVRRVVLVHGFLENGTTFRLLRKLLEAQGVECLVPKLRPSDGRGGLEGLAERLKLEIDAAYGSDQRISLISFSMGGLVSRYYLQNLGGATRCDKLFTVSSPHHGTIAAWIYPTKGAEQMRPGSRFLSDLQATESRLGGMPVVSYRTPLDLIILPPVSSEWNRAENLEYTVLLHPLMLSSQAVLNDLKRRLLEKET
jgi:triacylglycerol lipase